jgi:hypothetical protein
METASNAGQAAIAPYVFQVPGAPAVVQTDPMLPAATGVVNSQRSPTIHDQNAGVVALVSQITKRAPMR